MASDEPERPGATPTTLVVGGTTTYYLWIQQSIGPCSRFILRSDSVGNVFAAIGDEGCVMTTYRTGQSDSRLPFDLPAKLPALARILANSPLLTRSNVKRPSTLRSC